MKVGRWKLLLPLALLAVAALIGTSGRSRQVRRRAAR